jgi:hypothetical protein
VTTPQKEMRALAMIHLVAMVGLLIWWSIYFWRHSPAQEILALRSPIADAPATRPRRAVLEIKARGTLRSRTEKASGAVAVALPDIASGILFLVLFGVSTGIYVRRMEIWLQARGSGETMTLAGTGLGDKTLAANTDRQRSRS